MPSRERASASFTIVTRDESWIAAPHLLPREQRLLHGRADTTGNEIVACDTLDDELLGLVDKDLGAAVAALAAARPGGSAFRLVVSARRVKGVVIRETAIIISIGAFSVVSTPATLAVDSELLERIAAVRAEVDADVRTMPMVWWNGSASVLLHEAAGHPAEHGQAVDDWPAWLSIRDEPSFELDDAGLPPSVADLGRREAPTALRRASFSDVPLRRLSNVVVDHHATSFSLPDRRIDVLLVAGGHYDPLTRMARLFVSAADIVEGSRRIRARPFMMEAAPEEIARSVRGASGQPERYPGVVCSWEGQEIVVGARAPLLMTSFQ